MRVFQQLFGNAHPVLDQVIRGGLPDALPEAAQAFPAADGGRIRNLFQCQLVGIVFLNVGHHGQDPVLVHMPGSPAQVPILQIFQEQQPNIREGVPGLKLRILLLLQRGQFPQLLQQFFLRRILPGNLQDLQVFILQHRVQIFGLKNTFEMAT